MSPRLGNPSQCGPGKRVGLAAPGAALKVYALGCPKWTDGTGRSLSLLGFSLLEGGEHHQRISSHAKIRNRFGNSG